MELWTNSVISSPKILLFFPHVQMVLIKSSTLSLSTLLIYVLMKSSKKIVKILIETPISLKSKMSHPHPNLLPHLVGNLIDWYIWNTKMGKVLDEYKGRIDDNMYMVTGKIQLGDNFYCNYRYLDDRYNRYNTQIFKITKGRSYRDCRYGLPRRYRYSSGSGDKTRFWNSFSAERKIDGIDPELMYIY